MILCIDNLQTELPPPSDPDPAGASVVQEHVNAVREHSLRLAADEDPSQPA